MKREWLPSISDQEDMRIKIAITCEKRYVEGIVTSLECEGYHCSLTPIQLNLDNAKETALYSITGSCLASNRTARDEFYALRTDGWFAQESHVKACRIRGDNRDTVSWPM